MAVKMYEFRMPSLPAGIRELNTEHLFSLDSYFVYIGIFNLWWVSLVVTAIVSSK